MRLFITVLTFVLLYNIGVSAEALRCELWVSGGPPTEYGSEDYDAMRKRALIAEALVEKPSSGSLRSVLDKAGTKAKIPKIDYQYMIRATVFRKYSSGTFKIVINQKDIDSIPASSVYDTDLIIFHEVST